MFIDRPAPELGYLLLYIGLIVFLVLVPLFLRRFRKLRGLPAAAVFTVCFGAAAFFLVFIYSGFTTTYALDSTTLSMNSGFLVRGEVVLSDITEFRTIPTDWQALGWALNRTWYCNRFSRVLRLTTDKGVVSITPSDPARFEQEIRQRQKTSSLLRKNLIFK